MRLETALRIFGLNKNFTESELRKTYRKLISKYHPDLYTEKSKKEQFFAEEKAKEINTAKSVLEDYLKSSNTASKGYNRCEESNKDDSTI